MFEVDIKNLMDGWKMDGQNTDGQVEDGQMKGGQGRNSLDFPLGYHKVICQH